MPVAIRTRDNLFKLNLITAQMRSYLYFDGNSYVQFAPVVMSGTRTISFYVYFDDVSSTTSHYMYGNTEGYASRFVISYSGRFNIRANQSDNNSNFTEKSVFTSGIIHYVEVTITDTTCSVKVNGIEEYSETIPTADTYINLFGSNDTSVYGSFYLYDVSLNGERVYKLNEGAGRIVADSIAPEIPLDLDLANPDEVPSNISYQYDALTDAITMTLNEVGTLNYPSVRLLDRGIAPNKSYRVEVEIDCTGLQGEYTPFIGLSDADYSAPAERVLGVMGSIANRNEIIVIDDTSLDDKISFYFNATTSALQAGDTFVIRSLRIWETTAGQINNYQNSLWNQGLPS